MKISMAAGPYAHLARIAQRDGAHSDGLDIRYEAIEPGHIFKPMLNEGAWDVSEMSLSTAYILADRADPRFVVLPVFPSRAFRHSALYVPKGRAGQGMEGLRGGRIGVLRYGMTTAVWIRAMLADPYGHAPQSFRWFVGEDSPHPPSIAPEIVGPSALERMAVEGEIDCLISGRTPAAFHEGRLERLFPDFRTEEESYYRQTGVFPIMHVMIAKRSLFEGRPEVLAALLERFEAARRFAVDALFNFDISTYPLPWLPAFVEGARRMMGDDLWPYGIEANRKTLNAFGQAMAAEGLTSKALAPEDVFVGSPTHAA